MIISHRIFFLFLTLLPKNPNITMGGCFSKRGEPSSAANAPSTDPPKEKTFSKQEKKKVPEAAEKNTVFTAAKAAPAAKKAPCVTEEKEKSKSEIPVKKSSLVDEEKARKDVDVTTNADEQRPVPPRASSCTKEEVEAILIQCGRLSRSSSGKTSNETAQGGGQRRHSGSKRSYDFDKEKREEEEEVEKVSRPSPRRRTPGRERSGSRERGRRTSRSPGKRSDVPTSSASAGDKQKQQQQQPVKMVSVPAREKGASLSNGENECGSLGAKKASGVLKSSSPRSRSPANATRICNDNAPSQSLSRNSSRKADQSPYRRNPLAELDDNKNVFQARKEDDLTKHNDTEGINQTCSSKQRSGGAMVFKAKEQQTKKPESAEEATMDPKTKPGLESLDQRTLTRARSSRRSSRDLDNNPAFNPTSHASFLLEDIPNQQQPEKAEFSLPACLSKACSILEAVADLNSSSEIKSFGTNQSNNNKNVFSKDRFQRRGLLPSSEAFLESEMQVKDDIMEPSIHKYITMRDARREADPQESAGSNSFVGQPWPSPWETNSIDSTDRSCTWSGNGRDAEVEEEQEEDVDRVNDRQQRSRATSSTKGLTAAVSAPLGKKKREFDHLHRMHQSGNGRALSVPICSARS